MNKTGKIIVYGLGAVIVALLLVLVLVPGKKPADEASVPADWKTYASSTLGFSIQYPKEATVKEGDPGGFYIDQGLDSPMTAASIQFPRVDTFSENGSHGYYEFQVRLAVGDTRPFGGGCNAAASGGIETASGTTMLAGEKAYVFTASDAAAGNRLSFIRYALCHNSFYYSIYDIFASGSDGTPLTPKLEADIVVGKALSAQVAKSFQLTP